METPSNSIESLFERVEAYGKTTIELTKLKTLETTTAVATSLASRLIVFLMIAFFVLVLSIGVALFLGDLLEKSYYGFFIVAAFYLILGLILHYNLSKWINKPIGNFFISQFLQ
jgi:membrane-bound ClpP family serine protease